MSMASDMSWLTRVRRKKETSRRFVVSRKVSALRIFNVVTRLPRSRHWNSNFNQPRALRKM
jgi:hypothetical protein